MGDVQTFPCGSCGAQLEFDVGADQLECPYCGSVTAIPQSEDEVEELDFSRALARSADLDDQEEVTSLQCPNCAAVIDRPADVTAMRCCYCDTPLVDDSRHEQRLRPRSLLPFAIDGDRARKLYQEWIGKLWFAPNRLRERARTVEGLTGIYVPYWTYDCHATTRYTGERGEDYWVTESYTVRVNGKTQTRTRRKRKTRWYRASGVVGNTFDDLLVLASRSLPQKQAEELEPWHLEDLVPYQEEYLSGFRAERYQVDLEQGFERAKDLMAPAITATIKRDIGGDRQRIHSRRTRYANITFKHILLPVWITTFAYKDERYRVVVNARTGEVQGERPWSVWKITLAVLCGLAVVGILVALFNGGY